MCPLLREYRNLALVLFLSALLSPAAFAANYSNAPSMVCQASQFKDLTMLVGIAGLGMLALVALAYMAGEFLQNPKLITWAKSELMQVAASLVIAALLLFAFDTFCNLKVGEFAGIFSASPFIYTGVNSDLNLFDAATLYLENLQGICLRNLASIRFDLGAYEIRTSFTKYQCDSTCWLSMASTNVASYGGETVQMAIANNMLGAATVSFLSASFQYFTLQYIINGLFLIMLPLAIVVRSIPFMRNFGGALVGIFLALYLAYPLMVVFNAVVAPYIAEGIHPSIYDRDRTSCSGMDIYRDYAGVPQLNCLVPESKNGVNYEWELGGKGIREGDLPSVSGVEMTIRANALIFLTAVFLPALGFIVVAALARDTSRFLGDEADISRLGQMI